MKILRIYNKGDYNCNIIIKIGLEINENNDKIENSKNKIFFIIQKNNLY